MGLSHLILAVVISNASLPRAYIGRCYKQIDLGTQLSSGQFGEKLQHKIRIGWELFGDDEDGNPLTIDMDGKEMPLTISKATPSACTKSRPAPRSCRMAWP